MAAVLPERLTGSCARAAGVPPAEASPFAGHGSAIASPDTPDTTLMGRIRLLSDSCEVWRSGYSFCRGLMLQFECWFGSN